jgi:hypothetical protein
MFDSCLGMSTRQISTLCRTVRSAVRTDQELHLRDSCLSFLTRSTRYNGRHGTMEAAGPISVTAGCMSVLRVVELSVGGGRATQSGPKTNRPSVAAHIYEHHNYIASTSTLSDHLSNERLLRQRVEDPCRHVCRWTQSAGVRKPLIRTSCNKAESTTVTALFSNVGFCKARTISLFMPAQLPYRHVVGRLQ